MIHNLKNSGCLWHSFHRFLIISGEIQFCAVIRFNVFCGMSNVRFMGIQIKLYLTLSVLAVTKIVHAHFKGKEIKFLSALQNFDNFVNHSNCTKRGWFGGWRWGGWGVLRQVRLSRDSSPTFPCASGNVCALFCNEHWIYCLCIFTLQTFWLLSSFLGILCIPLALSDKCRGDN